MLRLTPNNSSVGVAPGTTTMTLGAACPPEAMPWMAYDRLIGVTGGGGVMQDAAAGNVVATAGGSGCATRAVMPYDDVGTMKGLGSLRASQVNARIRWDIIGLVGGGALVVALLAGLIADAMAPPRKAR